MSGGREVETVRVVLLLSKGWVILVEEIRRVGREEEAGLWTDLSFESRRWVVWSPIKTAAAAAPTVRRQVVPHFRGDEGYSDDEDNERAY